MSDNYKPALVPNTRAMPNWAENIPPKKNMPTQPNGKVENNSLILIGLVTSKARVGVIDNKIGAKKNGYKYRN